MAARQLTPVAPSKTPLRLRGVPVLLYHGLLREEGVGSTTREGRYWVSLPQFREHLRLLEGAGRRAMLLGELWGGSGTHERNSLHVALTFDDGRRSDYDLGFPALLEAGIRADFFVNTSNVGRPGYLDWRDILEMQSTGMAFHSHSHDHVDLSRLSDHALEGQLGESKWRLEDHLGRPVEFLAVPYGLLNERVVRVARLLGYRAVCTSRGWLARLGAATVNRVAVYRTTAPRDFQKLLEGNLFWYAGRAARAASFYFPKRILLHYCPDRLGVHVLEGQA